QFWESPEVINLEEKNHEEQYQQNQFDTTKQQRKDVLRFPVKRLIRLSIIEGEISQYRGFESRTGIEAGELQYDRIDLRKSELERGCFEEVNIDNF
ncbi:18067_t:CDS:1, partial [Dentiscutata erythropus]